MTSTTSESALPLARRTAQGRASPSAARVRRAGPAAVALAVATIALLFWRLGRRSLADYDEAIYAQVSKEIVESGDWLTLHWGYVPFFEKPPLPMWATAIFFHVFGVSEFWARAAAALSGAASLLVVVAIGRRLWSTEAGLLAGAVLLSSYQFVASSRVGTTDTMLTLWVCIAVYAYLRAREGREQWWWGVWIASAAAILTKSAAGIIAPAAVGLALLIDRRAADALRSRTFRIAALSAAGLVLLWHGGMYLAYGSRFVDVYLGRHLLERATTSMEGHVGGPDFYLDRLHRNFFPWVYLLPFALALALHEARTRRRGTTVLLGWIAVVFVLYTLVQTKISWYILPLYPALALLVARLVTRAHAAPGSLLSLGVGLAALPAMLLASPWVAWIGVVGSMLFGIAYWCGRPRLPARMLVPLACSLLALAGLDRLHPLFKGGETDEARISRAAGRAAPRDEPLLVYGEAGLFRPVPLFYSGRTVEMAWSPAQLDSLVTAPRTLLIAAREAETLGSDYEFWPLAQEGPFWYATVRKQTPP